MKVNLKELRAGVKPFIDFDYTTDLSEEEIFFEKPFKKPVKISGRVSDKAGIIGLKALITAECEGNCSRCGKPVSYKKEIPCDFILVKEGIDTEDEASGVFAVADECELDDILIPELILNMDMVTLCREDCKGLCFKCGHNLNEGDCGCDRTVNKSPFAVLKDVIQ